MKYFEGAYSKEFTQETLEAVFAFQKAHGIVQTKNDVGAGVFGPKTRAAFKKAVENIQPTQPTINISIISAPTVTPVTNNKTTSGKEEKIKQALMVWSAGLEKAKFGETNSQTKQIQKLLKAWGFFDYPETTGYFGPATKEAVIRYQIAKKIITNEADVGAGIIGPRTRESLTKELLDIINQKK